MQTHDSLLVRRTLTTVLGLAILGWTGAQPANAQATPKKTPSVVTMDDRSKQAMAERDAMDWDSDEADPTLVDPAPLSYPFAPPGGLDLNHYTDYTKTTIAPGSAEDERQARLQLNEKRRRAREEQMRAMFGNPGNYNTSGYSYSTYGQRYGDNPTYDNSRGIYPGGYSYSSMGSGAYMPNISPMATYGDYVYMLRGNTLVKLNSSDLSVVRQQDLPAWTGSMQTSNTGTSGTGIGSSSSSSTSTSTSVSGSAGNTSPGVSGTATNQNGQSNTNAVTGAATNGTSTSTAAQSTTTNEVATNGTSGTRRRYSRRSNGRNQGSAVMDTRTSYGGSMAAWPASITAGSDYVYVMRGNVLYQFRTSDLSLVSQKEMPSTTGYGSSGSSSSGSSGSYNTSGRTGTDTGPTGTGTGQGTSTGKTP